MQRKLIEIIQAKHWWRRISQMLLWFCSISAGKREASEKFSRTNIESLSQRFIGYTQSAKCTLFIGRLVMIFDELHGIAHVYQYLRMYRQLFSITIDTQSARIRRAQSTHLHFWTHTIPQISYICKWCWFVYEIFAPCNVCRLSTVACGISIQILLISTVSRMKQISWSRSIERCRYKRAWVPRANLSE